jgi:hypothetical protein
MEGNPCHRIRLGSRGDQATTRRISALAGFPCKMEDWGEQKEFRWPRARSNRDATEVSLCHVHTPSPNVACLLAKTAHLFLMMLCVPERFTLSRGASRLTPGMRDSSIQANHSSSKLRTAPGSLGHHTKTTWSHYHCALISPFSETRTAQWHRRSCKKSRRPRRLWGDSLNSSLVGLETKRTSALSASYV